MDYSNPMDDQKVSTPVEDGSKDVVDYIMVASKHNNNNSISNGKDVAQAKKKSFPKERLSLFAFGKNKAAQAQQSSAAPKGIEDNSSKALTPMALPPVPIGTPPRQHKFVKSSSIARLFGNSTYHAKKFVKESDPQAKNGHKYHTYSGRRRLSGPYLERFKRSYKEDGDQDNGGEESLDLHGENLCEESEVSSGLTRSELLSLQKLELQRHNEHLSHKAMRTLSRGLGKLWWKKTHSVEISSPDPEYKVSYLGNVLTGWAKGEGCVEKQLNTLWRNYLQNNKPDVIMRIKVCASGLKATTRQHGLTEYWANRITHCCAPKNYPRVFCWIYRHEGRKLKHELRCHAVLCSKEKVVHDICNTLKENLDRALREFKREKILKQNARLSLANAVYDNPSLPRRKILLSVGGNNYRPPLERSKSAPKLMAIEEAIGEEEGEEVEETNEPEMKSCCQKDSLYPAMTLGRRRCRKGHSIRRTGKLKTNSMVDTLERPKGPECCHYSPAREEKAVCEDSIKENEKPPEKEQEPQRHSYGSDDSDEFDKLLKYNNYDAQTPLSNELLPYFDMKLHKNTSYSLNSLTELKDAVDEPLSILSTINSDPNAHPRGDYKGAHDENDETKDDCSSNAEPVAMRRRSGVCSDGEDGDYHIDEDDEDDMYFRQANILNMLHRNSMRKMAQLSLSSGDESSSIDTNASAPLQYRHHIQSSISSNASSTTTATSTASSATPETSGSSNNTPAALRSATNQPDSDEGSISSGCETASTATTNQEEMNFFRFKQKGNKQLSAEDEEEPPLTAEEIYQRLESRLQGRHNSDATTFSSSSSITLKQSLSPASSLSGLDAEHNSKPQKRPIRRLNASQQDSDSECSDESGYVEFQEKDKNQRNFIETPKESLIASKPKPLERVKPQVPPKPAKPPKPMPRRNVKVATQPTQGGVSSAISTTIAGAGTQTMV